MNYIVIVVDENGVSSDWITHDEVLERITPDENGDSYYGGSNPITFLDEMPDVRQPDKAGIFIAKAEVCIPEPIEVKLAYILKRYSK